MPICGRGDGADQLVGRHDVGEDHAQARAGGLVQGLGGNAGHVRRAGGVVGEEHVEVADGGFAGGCLAADAGGDAGEMTVSIPR